MDINLFKEQKLNENTLDQFILANKNVLLIGEKGAGKSERVIQVFKKHFKSTAYLSGSTLDVWTDLVGLPNLVNTEKNGVKDTYVQYSRPSTIPEDVEAIFIDEFNRAPKKAKNAVLELIQFKSVNGRSYPNLKVVWAAVNPWDSDGKDSGYDVERLDPAHMDRFQVIIRLNSEPDIKYFKKTYQKQGEDAVVWWRAQGEEAKKTISARRLSYAIEAFKDKIDLEYVLPANSNVKELIKTLGMDNLEREFNEFVIEYKNHLKDPAKNSLPIKEIKAISEPGDKHNRFFERSVKELPRFWDTSHVFLSPEQFKAYESKFDKKKSSSSGLSSEVSSISELKGKKVSISGTHPSIDRFKLTQSLEKHGVIVSATVSKDIDYLLCNDLDKSSNKYAIAEKNGIKIIDGTKINFN